MAQIIIFLAGFIFRAGHIFAPVSRITNDSLVYDNLARDILQWGIFSVEMLKNFPLKEHPVYPIFIAVNYAVFGTHYAAIWLMQALIGVCVCLLVYAIARDLFSKRVAVTAGIISAAYPVFVRLSGLMLTENIFVFLFALVIWLIVRYQKTGRLVFLIFAACAFGTAVLTRSVVIPMVIFIPVYLFFFNLRRVSLAWNILHQALFVVVAVAFVLPWTLRNYVASGGSIIPVSEASDRGLYMSFRPYQGKIFGIKPVEDPVMQEAEKMQSFDKRKAFFMAKTMDYIRHNPGEVAKIEVLKFLYLWSPLDWEILGAGQARFNYGYAFIFPFFVYGLVRMIRNRPMAEKSILVLPVIYFQLIHLVYFALPRFRLGYEPFMIIIAAYGMDRWYGAARSKIMFLCLSAAFLAFNVLLFVYSPQAKHVLRFVCERLGVW